MFKNLKLVLVTTTVLISGVAGFAAAGGGHDKGAMKEKFAERKAAMLAKFDANKNGTLDPAEKQAMHDTRATKKFAALDTNKDGVLTLAEFKAGKGKGKGGMHHGRRGHGKHRGGMGGGGQP